MNDVQKIPCPDCGDMVGVDRWGLPVHYHDHKDLRYWKDRAEKMVSGEARCIAKAKEENEQLKAQLAEAQARVDKLETIIESILSVKETPCYTKDYIRRNL